MVVWKCKPGAARLVGDQCNVWEELLALQSHFCSGTEHQSLSISHLGRLGRRRALGTPEVRADTSRTVWATIGAAAHTKPAL